MELETLLKNPTATVLDVRTPAEFMGGHVAGSINIPLQEIEARIEEVKNLSKPLILCCASGGRSGQVQGYLSHMGIECVNAGSWLEVNFYKSKTEKA